MIRITVRRDSRGQIRGMRCSGHAAFDMEGGVDIVCAGVSALMGALALGLEKVVKISNVAKADDGFMEIVLPDTVDAEQNRSAQVLLKTTHLALCELKDNYRGFIEIV